MKKSFLTGAGILAISVFLAKIIGAFYRVPLTNAIGAEGMGVYQLIYPVYSFLLSTSSGALPVAISVLVSNKLALGLKDEAKGVLNSALSKLLMTGIFISMALVVFSGLISRIQGSSQAQLGYIAIAPSVFFVSGIAVLRGWFQGNGQMTPSAISQITEAFFKLSIGLTLAYIMLPYGIKWAVFGAMIGVTASEAITFLVMYFIFRRSNPPFKLSLNWKESKAKHKEVLKVSLPITIGGMILPITQIIDSLIVVNILSRTAAEAGATASYGLFTGYVSTLVNLPILLGLSLGIAVIPQLSKGRAEKDIMFVKQKSDSALKLALMIAFPFAFLYLVIPNVILKVLYPSITPAEMDIAVPLLRIGAITVVALSSTQIFTSLLQGLGDTYKPVINMAIGAGVKIVLDLSLLPLFGIYGVAAASAACFIVTAILNMLSVVRLMGKSTDLYKKAFTIISASGIMSAVVLFFSSLMKYNLPIIFMAAGFTLLYFVLLIMLRAFTENELLSLPFGKKLLPLSKIFDKQRG